MDTIIYLYRWKQPDTQLYQREDYVLQDYHLIKVGMAERLLQICEDNCLSEKERRKKERGGLWNRRRRRKKRQQEQLILSEFLEDLQPDPDSSSFVCEEPVSLFAGREFNGYFQADYVRHMLRYGGYTDSREAGERRVTIGVQLPHFVILGQSYCMTEIIYDYVRNMKSLKWIVSERQFREEQQELVDILYEEYGLAVEVRVLSEDESFAKVPPICRVPSIVLDFSEVERIPTADVARGSIWLDMASSEEKRRRIEDRDTGISYFSLKKEWKQPQKALNYLDTTNKNGYNT